MCGIFFSLGLQDYIPPDETLVRRLKLRGPDSYQEHKIEVQSAPPIDRSSKCTALGRVYLTFASSVLSLRGDDVSVQPFVDHATGSVFCWNGEAWRFNGEKICGNDTRFIFDRLLEAGRFDTDPTNLYQKNYRLQSLLDQLSSIAGPYSFIYFDGLTQSVICGRDSLGRRSLLCGKESPESVVVTSVSSDQSDQGYAEVGAERLLLIEIGREPSNHCEITHIPRIHEGVTGINALQLSNPLLSLNKMVSSEPPVPLGVDSESVSSLESHLRQSLTLRLLSIPGLGLGSDPDNSNTTSKVAILFSGGVDCSVLARLVHDILPLNEPIDLLNVVFENPRVALSSKINSMEALFEDCPDRITARSSVGELSEVCPDRTWRLITINVPYTEMSRHRPQIVSLIRPHNTEMDLSIACALYFAARGQGELSDPKRGHQISYTTPARVLFSGLGADELLGGYTRHATAFSRRHFHGLIEELELDITRLGKRNLGRDDRVISHWGREARYPYLDESLMNWAMSIPVWEKCGFGVQYGREKEPTEPGLEPGKLVLRLLAWRLGMKKVARERKRAIQFGARTAKMERGNRRGTETLS